MGPKPHIPAAIEEDRDERWRREGKRQVETAVDAERFIEQVGFAACMTDSRRPGPSLYVAVCGRRDAVMPRHVQKDPEASLTWEIKDELVTRGQVYYGKLARGTMFIAPRMLPNFHAVWGMRRSEEKDRLSRSAQAVLKTLRREWEMSTTDLRAESQMRDRALLSGRRRRDDSGRAGTCDGTVAARGRTRQPRASGRRLRDYARARPLSSGQPHHS